MTEAELPNFTLWLRQKRNEIAELVGVEGAEIHYTTFERVQRNMVTDKPMFDGHTNRMKGEVAKTAQMQGFPVEDVHVEVLKPEHLGVGDREALFPQHAKYTNILYYFGWCAPEQDWEPLGEDVVDHTMFLAVVPHEDGRRCAWHSRHNGFVFGEGPKMDKKCLRTDHKAAGEAANHRLPWED
jgi:hypothetical protein